MLKVHNGVAPRIYGLPKCHKEGFPLCPVISTIKSPMEALSTLLTQILSNIRNEEFNIRSSQDLQRRLKDVEIQEEEIFFSLDIVAMFPSICLQLAMDLILKRWDEIKLYAPMSKSVFKEMLEFCLK